MDVKKTALLALALLGVCSEAGAAKPGGGEIALLQEAPRLKVQPACLVKRDGTAVAGHTRHRRFVRFSGEDRTTIRLHSSKAGRALLRRTRAMCRQIGKKPANENPTPAPTAVPPQDGGGSGGQNQPPAAATPAPTPTVGRPPLTPTPAPTARPSLPAVPQLSAWEQQMLEYGARHCATLKGSASFDTKLASTYYDAEWVYYQIADYTGDAAWHDCARAAEAVYRDQYVLANNGAVPGYWNFSHGVAEDYLRTGDQQSRSAVVALATRAAYAVDGTSLAESASADYSREVAYTIMAYLNAESVGEPRRARLADMKQQALGHLNQWFVAKNTTYIRPFMVALTAHALISYDQAVGDAQILPLLKTAADWMWANMWVSSGGAFRYTNVDTAKFSPSQFAYNTGGTELAPDLNLLIAPLYAWIYHQTGDAVYRDRADQIFAGGVAGAYLANGKQFDQNYRWSFAYLKWRNEDPLR